MPLPALLLLACFASPADVDDPGAGASAFLSPPIDRIEYDEPGDGRLWARGSNYKASFGAEGATFIPFLGSGAARNWPATFQLDEVTVAGQSLELAGPSRSRDGDLVTLDRGGVAERYQVGLDAIEQSFAFESLPESGELILRLGVETDLEPVAVGAGWRFEGPEGGFDYGAATVLDAAGARLAIASEWDGRALVFRVPADFVAAAVFPLVVDPVIARGTIADLSANEREADVAYDPSWGKYMVSVEYVFSLSDSDVRVYEVTDSAPGTLGLNGRWIDMTTTTWRRPRIACRNIGNAFMVVATAGPAQSRYIGGRIRDVDVAIMNPPFVVSGSLSRCVNPDVGGDGRTGFASGDPGFVVVWEKQWIGGVEHAIYMRSYSREGQPLTQPATVASWPGQYLANPVISKTAGRVAPYEYQVAWEYRRSSTISEIQARRVSVTGAPVAPQYNVTSGGFGANPEVSTISTLGVPGHSGRAAVVVYEYATDTATDPDIHAAVCTESNAHPSVNITEQEGSAFGWTERWPAVSCDGDQWTIAYVRRWQFSTTDYNVYMTTAGLAGTGLGLSERKHYLGQSSTPEKDPRLASRWEAGHDVASNGIGQSFAVWTDEDLGNGRIEGAYVSTTLDLVCGSQYCEANTNSIFRRGWLAAFGDTSPSSSKRLWVRDAAPNAAAYFLVSASVGSVTNVGGSEGNLCLGSVGFGRYASSAGSTDVIGRWELVIDPTRIPQPTSTVAATSGETWYFQCWYRDQVGGMATSNLTNAVAIPFQ